MDVQVEFKWNPKVQKGLKVISDDILYAVAKQTLDFSVPMIPRSLRKYDLSTLRGSSVEYGVHRNPGDMVIGSTTSYAKYVWKMKGVHWTTSGTNNKWFSRALKTYSATIINNAINQAWKKDM